MSMLKNEVAADNERRMFDNLQRSPANQALEVVSDAVPVIGTALRLRDRFLRLGVPTVEENLDHLGKATEEAVSRIDRKLVEQDELKARIESSEFQESMTAAVLQTQRTTQKARLERMASILANGLAANDLEPESMDDMLRATVELKEADIVLLNKIYESQAGLVDRVRRGNVTNWHGEIIAVWREFIRSGNLTLSKHLDYRSSLSRLESFGLVQRLDIPRQGVGAEIYALLSEGKKFCERVKEIASDTPID